MQHLETSFKLIHHKYPYIVARAYNWLKEILYKIPQEFLLGEFKKRIRKSIFTNAIYNIERDLHSSKND